MSTVLINIKYTNDGTIHPINIQPGFSAVSVRCMFALTTTSQSGAFIVDSDITTGILCVFAPEFNHWSEPVTLSTSSAFTNSSFNFSTTDIDGNILDDFSVTSLTLLFSSA